MIVAVLEKHLRLRLGGWGVVVRVRVNPQVEALNENKHTIVFQDLLQRHFKIVRFKKDVLPTKIKRGP